MTAPVWRLRLTDPAEQDFAAILQETWRLFGERQVGVYAATIDAALAALADGPNLLGSIAREEIGPGVRTLHVARRSRRGRHLILYKAGDDNVIEVLRILHDAMDVARHAPPGAG